jgi:hypothetical protein
MRVSAKLEAREDEAGASWTALGGLEMIGVPEKLPPKVSPRLTQIFWSTR